MEVVKYYLWPRWTGWFFMNRGPDLSLVLPYICFIARRHRAAVTSSEMVPDEQDRVSCFMHYHPNCYYLFTCGSYMHDGHLDSLVKKMISLLSSLTSD